jgi:hypothetical protein
MYNNQYTQFQSILEGLNINPEDSLVYEYFYIHPSNTISKCATDLSIYRWQVYASIKALKEIDLIDTSYPKVKVKDPSILIARLEYKSVQLSSAAKNLDKLIPKIQMELVKNNINLVEVFVRKHNLLRIVNEALDGLDENETVLIFDESEEFYRLIEPKYIESTLVNKRVKMRIKAEVIIRGPIQSEIMDWVKKDKEQLRVTKLISPDSQLKGAFWVFGTKVILWNNKESTAIVINNQFYSEMFSSYFQLIFKTLSSVI